MLPPKLRTDILRGQTKKCEEPVQQMSSPHEILANNAKISQRLTASGELREDLVNLRVLRRAWTSGYFAELAAASRSLSSAASRLASRCFVAGRSVDCSGGS